MRSPVLMPSIAVIVGCIFVAIPATVVADPGIPGTDWQALKDRGTVELEGKHFTEALRLYREAALAQHRAHRAEQTILSFNIALAYVGLDRIDVAWRRFAQLARQAHHPGVARAAAAEMEALRTAREGLPQLTVDCEPGLRMRIATLDGYVLTSGKEGWTRCEEGGSQWNDRVLPGDYVIRFKAGSYEGAVDLQMAAADQHHHVYLPAAPSGGMCAGRPGQ